MFKTNNISKQGWFKAAILMAIMALLLIVYCVAVKKPTEGKKTIHISVEHFNKEKYPDKELAIETTEEFLRKAVEPMNLVEGEESTYGLWITAVDGEEADASKQQWWGIYINGEMGNFGIDEQPVTDGETYTFRLVEGY